MRSLVQDSHLFDLKGVISEFDSRMESPVPLFLQDSQGKDTDVESPESISSRLRAYDDYEKYDIAFSRLVIEALISPTYRETAKTRFSHHKDFADLPAQIYFMMVLSACNTSASIDIDTAKLKFKELSLSSFPGENVSSLITLALKYFKVMQAGHYLPEYLSTELLLKCSKTQSEIFNRKVLTQYSISDELERELSLIHI